MRRRAAAHSRWKWSGTATSSASRTWWARRLPSSVHSTISTPAEASKTMAGTAGSDLAELASLGQVISDPLPKPAWLRLADRLHPGPRVEVAVVVAALRQDHDTLRRVLKIRSDHGPSVAARYCALMVD